MPTLTFNKANKLITVLKAGIPEVTEITIQELINTIRDWEGNLENMDVAKIADASGKEDLGGGLQVGITLKLLNWKLKFEARPGPDWIDCAVSGGNLVAVNGNNQPMNPIQPSDYVTVTIVKAVSAALMVAIAEWTQAEKDDIFARIAATRDEVLISQTDILSVQNVVETIQDEVLVAHDTLHLMKDKSGASFDRETDSLEAIRDRGDEAWATGEPTEVKPIRKFKL